MTSSAQILKILLKIKFFSQLHRISFKTKSQK